jgi:hypothetical protein
LQQPDAAYVQPTRALLLQLSRFPVAMIRALQVPLSRASSSEQELQCAHPLLTALLQRAASMRLRWDSAPAVLPTEPQAAASASASSSDPLNTSATMSDENDERSAAVALRLLGLSGLEHAAAAHRRQQVHAARLASSVVASPAAAYPPAFGAPGVARLELITNHLPLHLLASARRTALLLDARPDVRALAEHCNAPRFLSLQADDTASSTGEHHSSVPLRDAAERTLFIQRTLRLVAARLGLRCAGDQASPSPSAAQLSTSTSAAASTGCFNAPHSPPAHVVLLHLDAESLVGPMAATVSTTTQPTPSANAAPAGVEHQQRARIALGMVELLLVTLMAQLKFNPPVASVPAASPSSSSSPPFSLPVSLPHAVLQAASELLSSRLLCPVLMWSIVIDDDEDVSSVAASSPSDHAAQLRAQTIAALRPVQSYRVQDGCISRTDERQWRSCSAFVYHAETTRIAAGLDGVAPSSSSSSTASSASLSSPPATGPPPPLHGSLHIMHLMRELLFKLGLGSKYGA